ncbi:hypothetical protein [Endozoicomonas sp. SCSIO W0465]|uniref:hypothetical protein n=1 Tax=Endozoicomonas sp. SCSIO W0465 TaxID=2918516 RepID=UPI0020755D28|nr:hypothetical protein [Endozoicomonas sp. SCSIO W0465]USE34111.1 hypothetical protein MJO57_18280 [Endozoicomonas sp. SCSIO W0465]
MDLDTQGKIIEDVANEVVSLEDQAGLLEQQARTLRSKANSARTTLLHTIVHLNSYLVQHTGSERVLPEVFHINNLLIDLTDQSGHVEITPLDDLNHYLKPVG